MVTYTDSAAHGADTVKRAMSLTVMSAVRLTGGYTVASTVTTTAANTTNGTAGGVVVGNVN